MAEDRHFLSLTPVAPDVVVGAVGWAPSNRLALEQLRSMPSGNLMYQEEYLPAVAHSATSPDPGEGGLLVNTPQGVRVFPAAVQPGVNVAQMPGPVD